MSNTCPPRAITTPGNCRSCSSSKLDLTRLPAPPPEPLPPPPAPTDARIELEASVGGGEDMEATDRGTKAVDVDTEGEVYVRTETTWLSSMSS